MWLPFYDSLYRYSLKRPLVIQGSNAAREPALFSRGSSSGNPDPVAFRPFV